MSTEPKHQDESQKKKRRWLLLILLVLLLLLLGFGCMAKQAHDGNGDTDTAASDFFDPDAQNGNLPGMTEEEIQAELDKIVEEGMFNISIASVVTVDANTGEAMIRIENIAANHHNMTVAITLDGEDGPIYQSAGLAPGQYIESAALNRKLPAGQYSATALFTAYDLKTLEPQGQAAAKITLIVGS